MKILTRRESDPKQHRAASVIVPVYNEERYLERCLQALCAQNCSTEKFEILVVDDGSIDKTGNIARAFLDQRREPAPEITYVKIAHAGLSVARNAGLALARGEIAVYTDGDCVADQNWLANLLICFERDKEAVAVGGRIKLLNEQSWLARLLDRYFYDIDDRQAIIGANMAFRKSYLMRVGGFYDVFQSRGDETTILALFEKNGWKAAKAMNAWVAHERPERLKNWLHEVFVNGRMSIRSAHLLGKNTKRTAFCSGTFLLKATILSSFLPLLVASAGKPGVLAWSALLFVYWVRCAAVWKKKIQRFEVKGGYRFPGICMAVGLGILGNVYFHIGVLREVVHLWKYGLERTQTFDAHQVELAMKS